MKNKVLKSIAILTILSAVGCNHKSVSEKQETFRKPSSISVAKPEDPGLCLVGKSKGGISLFKMNVGRINFQKGSESESEVDMLLKEISRYNVNENLTIFGDKKDTFVDFKAVLAIDYSSVQYKANFSIDASVDYDYANVDVICPKLTDAITSFGNSAIRMNFVCRKSTFQGEYRGQYGVLTAYVVPYELRQYNVVPTCK